MKRLVSDEHNIWDEVITYNTCIPNKINNKNQLKLYSNLPTKVIIEVVFGEGWDLK